MPLIFWANVLILFSTRSNFFNCWSNSWILLSKYVIWDLVWLLVLLIIKPKGLIQEWIHWRRGHYCRILCFGSTRIKCVYVTPFTVLSSLNLDFFFTQMSWSICVAVRSFNISPCNTELHAAKTLPYLHQTYRYYWYSIHYFYY